MAVDDDPLFLKIVEDHLTQGGMEFHGLREPTRVVPESKSFEPDLILMDRTMRVLTGGEVIRSLRAFPQTAGIPVAFVLADNSERELIRALQAGAVDVMHKPFGPEHVTRIRALLEELGARGPAGPITREDMIAANFLDFARRTQLHGTLLVNRGTPFEGRVAFQRGALLRADYGPLGGMEAVRELLQLEEGLFELDGTTERPAVRIAQNATELLQTAAVTPVPGDPAQVKPRLMVVDDEPHLRRLFSAQLTRAGFEVEVAEDGAAAVAGVLASPFDLVVADLNMPRMDGWEMLKILKADHRTREVPVIFLSAHEDYRETLKAARAGAHDYLAKTGRSEHVVRSALQVITPRLEAMFEILVGQPMRLKLQAIGLQWFLRALVRTKSTGTLELNDDWGRYQLHVREGQPIAASADMRRRGAEGVAAVAAMLVARFPQGSYTQGAVEDARIPIEMSMENLLQRTCERLNALEARLTANRLAAATEFDVDQELYELFRKIASERRAELARAVCEHHVAPAQLPEVLQTSPDEVADGLRELLRRGVIRFRAAA